MLIRFKGDKEKIKNYTKLGRVIPNDLTEIDIVSFFDTQRYTEKEIISKLKEDPNIELADVDKVIEDKITLEIEEKKTEVIADPVKDGIEFEIDTRNQKRRGRKK